MKSQLWTLLKISSATTTVRQQTLNTRLNIHITPSHSSPFPPSSHELIFATDPECRPTMMRNQSSIVDCAMQVCTGSYALLSFG